MGDSYLRKQKTKKSKMSILENSSDTMLHTDKSSSRSAVKITAGNLGGQVKAVEELSMIKHDHASSSSSDSIDHS